MSNGANTLSINGHIFIYLWCILSYSDVCRWRWIAGWTVFGSFTPSEHGFL